MVTTWTRVTAGGLALVQGGLLTWGAFSLPWSFDAFSAVLLVTGAVHLASAGAAAALPGAFPRVWRVQGWLSLALLGYLGWVVASSVSYMVGVYGDLGAGLGAAMLAAYAPFALVLLPTAVWALVVTRAGGHRAEAAVLGLALLIFGGDVVRWRLIGAGETWVRDAQADAVLDQISSLGAATATTAPSGSLMSAEAASCPPFGEDRTRVLATYVDLSGRARTLCWSGAAEEVVAAVGRELSTRARGLRARVDLVLGEQALDRLAPLAPPFVVRPGLDGVCAGSDGGTATCVMPWQLVALDQFNAFRPLPFIPDLRLGVDPASLRQRLGVPEPEEGKPPFVGLRRVRVASLVRGDDGVWRRFVRGRPPREAAEPSDVESAARAASGFVHRAQIPDGRFTYRTDPYRGTVDHGSFSVARQAGTTLALCELGDRGSQTQMVSNRSVLLMERLILRAPGRPEVGAVSWPRGRMPSHFALGPSALSLVAILTCRERFGFTRLDPTIAALGELMLASLLPTGRFTPYFDVQKGAAHDAPFSLYADGQAVYALVMLERLARAHPEVLPKSAEVYGEAAERAMTFYGEEYWHHPARRFFFIEENWHCLAARAALETRRHDAYERFCLDYIKFKTRTVLAAGGGYSPDAVGGNGFANVTAPYNTPTAGYGEASSAALAVAKVRGVSMPAVEAGLRSTLDFLVHTQWDKVACFACTDRLDVTGGFSESLASPVVRIDYVQHAWAALGHGSRVLGLDAEGAARASTESGRPG